MPSSIRNGGGIVGWENRIPSSRQPPGFPLPLVTIDFLRCEHHGYHPYCLPVSWQTVRSTRILPWRILCWCASSCMSF